MHIPDNYLSPSTCAVLGTVMLPILKRAASHVKNEIGRKKIPLLGICSAFSFLIMMFNLPLPGGTTGHAVGAVLAAVLLGPYAAVISITIALVIQALFFGDGGILALGANIFNMAFIMPFTGYYIYHFLKKRFTSTKGTYVSVFIAAYMGIAVASLCAAVELGIQPLLFKDALGAPLYCPYPLQVSILAMVIPHLIVVGVVEGLITTGVYTYIQKVSPSILYKGSTKDAKPVYLLLLVLILLCPVGLLASGTAWGEWSTGELKNLTGYVPNGMKQGFDFKALMPDYSVSNHSTILGYIISAVLGAAFILIIFRVIAKKNRIDQA